MFVNNLMSNSKLSKTVIIYCDVAGEELPNDVLNDLCDPCTRQRILQLTLIAAV